MEINKLVEESEKIISLLKKKYNINSDIILKTMTPIDNNTNRGSASYLRNKEGFKFVYDKSKFQIVISDKIKNDKELLATVTHEFSHIMQMYHMGESKYKQLQQEKPKVKFTHYNKNLCEIQAEAFTIYEIGYSNNSVIGAKNLPDYTETIIGFFDQLKK